MSTVSFLTVLDLYSFVLSDVGKSFLQFTKHHFTKYIVFKYQKGDPTVQRVISIGGEQIGAVVNIAQFCHRAVVFTKHRIKGVLGTECNSDVENEVFNVLLGKEPGSYKHHIEEKVPIEEKSKLFHFLAWWYTMTSKERVEEFLSVVKILTDYILASDSDQTSKEGEGENEDTPKPEDGGQEQNENTSLWTLFSKVVKSVQARNTFAKLKKGIQKEFEQNIKDAPVGTEYIPSDWLFDTTSLNKNNREFFLQSKTNGCVLMMHNGFIVPIKLTLIDEIIKKNDHGITPFHFRLYLQDDALYSEAYNMPLGVNKEGRVTTVDTIQDKTIFLQPSTDNGDKTCFIAVRDQGSKEGEQLGVPPNDTLVSKCLDTGEIDDAVKKGICLRKKTDADTDKFETSFLKLEQLPKPSNANKLGTTFLGWFRL